MKILQVVPSLRTGGAETLVRHYCIKLSKTNDVKCIVMGRCVEDEPNKKAMDGMDIPIIYLRKDKVDANILIKIWSNISMCWKLLQLIYKERPQIVHFHLVYFRYLLITLVCWRDCKYFYTLHSVIPRSFRTKGNFMLARLVNRVKLVKFITLHNDMEKDFERLFKGPKGIIVKNGIDIRAYIYKNFKRDEYRKELGISKNDFVVGHVGSLIPVKNHLFLLQVFTEVLRLRAQCKLLLIGSGTIENEIMKKAEQLNIKDKIIWLKNRSDIPELLSVMDVFVFPSIYEGFPLAVLEAQAAGLRCIISDSITDDVLLTDNICKMDIKTSPKVWAKEIIQPTVHELHTGIEEYDLDRILERVVGIYEGKIVE